MERQADVSHPWFHAMWGKNKRQKLWHHRYTQVAHSSCSPRLMDLRMGFSVYFGSQHCCLWYAVTTALQASPPVASRHLQWWFMHSLHVCTMMIHIDCANTAACLPWTRLVSINGRASWAWANPDWIIQVEGIYYLFRTPFLVPSVCIRLSMMDFANHLLSVTVTNIVKSMLPETALTRLFPSSTGRRIFLFHLSVPLST